ncbi:large conductance mechanosensitive channel protein MscL [Euzebya pacifica]|uniref:large conductance mechanosensitive channel protein MscL n=1 Tax=Euzebya pacifica TaxID=1608957 RepID=UPI0030F6CBFF
MLKEFKEFLMKGNVIDLAVAVVIGAAFAAIIAALVEGIINPIIAAIVGQPDITQVTTSIGSAELLTGQVIGAIINFVLVGLVLFLLVKAANKAMDARKKEPEEVEVVADPEEILLLREIRDSLSTRA